MMVFACLICDTRIILATTPLVSTIVCMPQPPSKPPALTKHQAQALLAPTTQLEDVFFGFYHWLDQHPTEAVLISLNHEGGTGTPNDVKIQQHIYNLFDTQLAKRYWVQKNGTVCPLNRENFSLTLPSSVQLEKRVANLPFSSDMILISSVLRENPTR